MLCFVLRSSFSLFTIFQLSCTVFAFFGLSTIGSSLTFSVLFLLFGYSNILFYSWHCVHSLQTVYTMLTSYQTLKLLQFQKFQLINPDFLSF